MRMSLIVPDLISEAEAYRRVNRERARQIKERGYSPAHDNGHTPEEWRRYMTKHLRRMDFEALGAMCVAALAADERRKP